MSYMFGDSCRQIGHTFVISFPDGNKALYPDICRHEHDPRQRANRRNLRWCFRGSSFSSTSIWNQFSQYGSPFSTYSACNQFATQPPILLDANSRSLGELTLNTLRPNAIRTSSLGCRVGAFGALGEYHARSISSAMRRS